MVFVEYAIYRTTNIYYILQATNIKWLLLNTNYYYIATKSLYIFEAFSKHSQVVSVYLDFPKSFDLLNHCALLSILLNLGFGEPLLLWFSSYLSERRRVVKINGFCTSPLIVTSGVPQGGHLSPVLFALFVNGIKDVLQPTNFCCLMILNS